MAVHKVKYSDKSGDPIPDGTGARIRVQWFDRGKVDLRCDLTDQEVELLLGFAQRVEIRPERRSPPSPVRRA